MSLYLGDILAGHSKPIWVRAGFLKPKWKEKLKRIFKLKHNYEWTYYARFTVEEIK